MIVDRTLVFLESRKVSCAEMAESTAIVQQFIEHETRSGRAYAGICMLCNGCGPQSPPPVCRRCISRYFLRAEGFCPPETYELCSMIWGGRVDAKDMQGNFGMQFRSLCMGGTPSRCVQHMCMNIARLVHAATKKRMREREQRRHEAALLAHYRELKSRYMSVLRSPEWDSLFAVKSMLSEILQNIYRGAGGHVGTKTALGL